MMREISPKIWIPVMVVLFTAVVSLLVFFAWPEKEEVPEEVTAPEVTPTEEEITPPPGIAWNVPEGEIDFEVEQKIKKAIYNDSHLISVGKELESKGEFLSIETLIVKDEWAVVGYAARYKETREFVPAGPARELLRKVNQDWEIARDKETFCQWLSLTPESFRFLFYLDLCEQEE